MPTVKLRYALKHQGTRYAAGDSFEGEQDLIDKFIADGTAVDPKAIEETTGVSLADAEAQAKAIVDKANEQAESTAKEANEAAAKVVADAEAQAKADAEKVVKAAEGQASKLVADAKTEADKIVKAAKPATPAPAK